MNAVELDKGMIIEVSAEINTDKEIIIETVIELIIEIITGINRDIKQGLLTGVIKGIKKCRLLYAFRKLIMGILHRYKYRDKSIPYIMPLFTLCLHLYL